MPNREEINICQEKLLLTTTTGITSGTVTSGTAVDTTGFDSCHFSFHTVFTGSAPVVAATQTGSDFRIMESDDGTTFTLAPDASVTKGYLPDGSALAQPATGKALRMAYVGNKKYAKPETTAPVGGMALTIMGHLGYASRKPPANPA